MSSGTMVRIVRNIQRNRPPWVMIDDTGRLQFGKPELLKTMPFGRGPEEVRLVYFKPRSMILTPEEIVGEFENMDLMPDFQAQITDNEQNPLFADKYENYMQWNLRGRKATHLLFRKVVIGRSIECRRGFYGLPSGYWLAGVSIHSSSLKL